MSQIFKQVFTRNERERKTAAIYAFMGPATLEYVRALEDIAKTACDYADNSTSANLLKLDEALAKVDRMRP